MNKPAYAIVFFAMGFVIAAALFGYPLESNPRLQAETIPALNQSDVNQTNACIQLIQNQTPERTIPIVAVSQNEESGIIGNLTVRLIPGNSQVLIETNPFLEPDLQYSVNTAVNVAKRITKAYDIDKDFVFTYGIKSQVVGGGSAGAATAVAIIAAITNKSIRQDAVITGSIGNDGSIGEVGAVLEKTESVALSGYKLFLVPKGQTKMKYYEKSIVRQPTGLGFMLYRTRYVPKTIDIKQMARDQWGLEIEEVSNIDEAVDRMLE